MIELDYKLAKLSGQAYKEKTFSSGDVEVLVTREDNKTFIAIRGTEASSFFSGRGWRDVIRDLRAWPADIGNTQAHSGFASGFEHVVDYLNSEIKADDNDVHLTGHSMGGSIALISAYAMQLDSTMRERFVSCVTFGAPRTMAIDNMKPDILDGLQRKVRQYQHVKDIVPGFLGFTRYEHINNRFLPVRMRHSNRGWYFSRDWKYHGIEVYISMMGQMVISRTKP